MRVITSTLLIQGFTTWKIRSKNLSCVYCFVIDCGCWQQISTYAQILRRNNILDLTILATTLVNDSGSSYLSSLWTFTQVSLRIFWYIYPSPTRIKPSTSYDCATLCIEMPPSHWAYQIAPSSNGPSNTLTTFYPLTYVALRPDRARERKIDKKLTASIQVA